MLKLLKKELRLTASPLSYAFIAFGLLAQCPGYPILVGSFFLCLGLFQSFQAAREANDILYTALLPVRKSDVVRGKYAFCLFIELCYFIVTSSATLFRMTALRDAAVYRTNALMNANLAYLGCVLVIFGLNNSIFVGGFFKTAYKFGRPFVLFTVAGFAVVSIAETLVHVPGLGALNAAGFEHPETQLTALIIGAAVFAVTTALSQKRAVSDFERADL